MKKLTISVPDDLAEDIRLLRQSPLKIKVAETCTKALREEVARLKILLKQLG